VTQLFGAVEKLTLLSPFGVLLLTIVMRFTW
jgi:hypothetical protein